MEPTTPPELLYDTSSDKGALAFPTNRELTERDREVKNRVGVRGRAHQGGSDDDA
jgi:hypothetical protein